MVPNDSTSSDGHRLKQGFLLNIRKTLFVCLFMFRDAGPHSWWCKCLPVHPISLLLETWVLSLPLPKLCFNHHCCVPGKDLELLVTCFNNGKVWPKSYVGLEHPNLSRSLNMLLLRLVPYSWLQQCLHNPLYWLTSVHHEKSSVSFRIYVTFLCKNSLLSPLFLPLISSLVIGLSIRSTPTYIFFSHLWKWGGYGFPGEMHTFSTSFFSLLIPTSWDQCLLKVVLQVGSYDFC